MSTSKFLKVTPEEHSTRFNQYLGERLRYWIDFYEIDNDIIAEKYSEVHKVPYKRSHKQIERILDGDWHVSKDDSERLLSTHISLARFMSVLGISESHVLVDITKEVYKPFEYPYGKSPILSPPIDFGSELRPPKSLYEKVSRFAAFDFRKRINNMGLLKGDLMKQWKQRRSMSFLKAETELEYLLTDTLHIEPWFSNPIQLEGYERLTEFFDFLGVDDYLEKIINEAYNL